MSAKVPAGQLLITRVAESTHKFEAGSMALVVVLQEVHVVPSIHVLQNRSVPQAVQILVSFQYP